MESLLAPDRHGQLQCRKCGTWLQRTPDGTVMDGLAEHRRTVHGG